MGSQGDFLDFENEGYVVFYLLSGQGPASSLDCPAIDILEPLSTGNKLQMLSLGPIYLLPQGYEGGKMGLVRGSCGMQARGPRDFDKSSGGGWDEGYPDSEYMEQTGVTDRLHAEVEERGKLRAIPRLSRTGGMKLPFPEIGRPHSYCPCLRAS